jgi:predicted RNA-binding Zn-ribbon protein involved in translation (DUF1610 family)
MSYLCADDRELLEEHILFVRNPTKVLEITRYMVLWQPRSVHIGDVFKHETESSLKVGRLRYHIRHPKKWRWEVNDCRWGSYSDRIDRDSRAEAVLSMLHHYKRCDGTRDLEEKHMMSFNRCPFCGDENISRCKCPRNDCSCSNGHHWHWSLQEGVFHEGPADHNEDLSADCCVEKKVFTPFQKK